MNRRDFIKKTGALAATSLGLASAVSKEHFDKKPVIVDTHLHCFSGTDDQRFPYNCISNPNTLPALNL